MRDALPPHATLAEVLAVLAPGPSCAWPAPSQAAACQQLLQVLYVNLCHHNTSKQAITYKIYLSHGFRSIAYRSTGSDSSDLQTLAVGGTTDVEVGKHGTHQCYELWQTLRVVCECAVFPELGCAASSMTWYLQAHRLCPTH